MTQNQFGFETEKEAPTLKNAAHYRAVARERMKNFYWIIFLGVLLAGLLGGLVQGETVSTPSFDYETEVKVNFPVESIDDLTWENLKPMLAEELKIPESFFDGLLPVLAVIAVISLITTAAFTLLVGAPIALGFQRLLLNLMDGKNVRIEVLFSYFKIAYGKAIGLRFLHGLIRFGLSLPFLAITVALLAFYVTGSPFTVLLPLLFVMALLAVATSLISIVVEYRYYYAYTILAEHPEMRPVDALRNSARLMKGNKWRLFCLQISFIGWIILSIFTCGIGAMFLSPYTHAANIAFYDDITNRAAVRAEEEAAVAEAAEETVGGDDTSFFTGDF